MNGSSLNINTITTSGIYYIASNVQGIPVATYGLFIFIIGNSGGEYQFYLPIAGSDVMYFRKGADNTIWTRSWTHISFTA